jgi:hypothetical protein
LTVETAGWRMEAVGATESETNLLSALIVMIDFEVRVVVLRLELEQEFLTFELRVKLLEEPQIDQLGFESLGVEPILAEVGYFGWKMVVKVRA